MQVKKSVYYTSLLGIYDYASGFPRRKGLDISRQVFDNACPMALPLSDSLFNPQHTEGHFMNSLFIVSLPRSFSSETYKISQAALGLASPSWTTDGEILNLDRYSLFPGPIHDTGIKFIAKEREPQLFQRVTDFLEQVVTPLGFVYKDVVNPFIVSEWLKGRDFRVLRIKRDLTDVVFTMLNRRWFYPRRAVGDGRNGMEEAMIEGLVRADAALAALPAVQLDFDDLISNESVLRDALTKLYPDFDGLNVSYINDSFHLRKEALLASRKTNAYRAVRDRVMKVVESQPV